MPRPMMALWGTSTGTAGVSPIREQEPHPGGRPERAGSATQDLAHQKPPVASASRFPDQIRSARFSRPFSDS
jgi:hypothetical protein